MLLNETIDRMAEDISGNLEGILFKTVVLKIRYQDFETHTKQKTLMNATNDIDTLKLTAKEILTKFTDSKKKIRLIGVRVTSLSFSS